MALLLALLASSPSRGDDAEIARLLRELGVKVVESAGVVTSVEAGDCSKWTDEEFRRIGRLAGLKSLSFGPGLGDASLAHLAGLSELESLSSNLSTITDEGMKGLAPLKKLKILKFFHPAKALSGAGLVHLADLPSLERLTVAGSLAFNDDGMAAAGKLERLKELRTWHAGTTLEGVRKLKDLKNLKSLTLGQRLAYAPPTSVSDETIAVLAGMKSLETLRLEEARLKFDALVQLKGLPDLKSLTLDGIDIPEADVERLRKELPKVQVQWTKPNPTYLKRIQKLFGGN